MHLNLNLISSGSRVLAAVDYLRFSMFSCKQSVSPTKPVGCFAVCPVTQPQGGTTSRALSSKASGNQSPK